MDGCATGGEAVGRIRSDQDWGGGAGSLTISGTPRAGLQLDFESWSLRDWGLESHETMSTEGEFCAEEKLRAIPLSGSWLEGRVGR